MSVDLANSEDSSPPLFQVGPKMDGYGCGGDSCRVERCPLCNQKTKAFYCKDCVRNGNFYHSRMTFPERYADKKLRYFRLRRELLEQEEEVTRLYHTKTKHRLLKEQVAEVRDRVALLRLVVEATKDNVTKVRKQSADLSKSNDERRQQLPIFQLRLSKMKKILYQYQEKIHDKKEHLTKNEAQLKGVVRGNIRELTRFIFPIIEVQPARSVDTDPEHSDTVSAIAEASQTTYVRGRWVYTDTSHETQYRIVHPLLPGSGDYSAYNLLSVVKSGGECEEGEGEERSGSYSVCAGLTYLTQLVNTLAFYLDVTLPKKLCYSEFCRNELSEQQFSRRVARLNTNVIYLCLSQSVPAKVLRPSHSTPNLLALLDTHIADLGRQGSFEIAESLVESMEEGMEEDNAEGSDSEEEEDTDTLSAEWETVPNLPLIEPTFIPTHQAFSTFNSQAVYSQAAVGGIGTGGAAIGGMAAGAGGIVSSAAASVMSLFRGFGANQQK